MSFFKNALNLYVQGFKTMSFTSKKLWLIVLIKLFIMFGVLKVFFFNDTLDSKYETETEISNHIFNELTESNK